VVRDPWSWTNEQKMGDMTMKGRFTMKVSSPASYYSMDEVSEDGTKWSAVMEGRRLRKNDGPGTSNREVQTYA
jgi:hypothetical protein